MNVDIIIRGLEKDSRLLKKILRRYCEQATSAYEKACCECYIELIEQAEKIAEEKQNGEEKLHTTH